eukprot:484690-Pleurochrysis_carterae.AAC.4
MGVVQPYKPIQTPSAVTRWSLITRLVTSLVLVECVPGDDEVNIYPTCAHHAISNIFEEGRKIIDAVVRETINITDEMVATDAKNVKAMRTSVGSFSSPSCPLIYQLSLIHI